MKLLTANKVIKNGIWLYLLQFFNTIVPLLTLPYITRIFGAEKYGAFSIAFNIYGYIQVIIEYGFLLSVTRKMALQPENISLACNLFSSVLLARLFLASIGTTIAGIYTIINWHKRVQSVCLIIMSLCSFGYCMQINWFFQGIQNMQYISITTIFARSLTMVCIFLFVKSADDIYLYSFFMTILPMIYGSIGLVIAHRKYFLHFNKVSLNAVINELKDGFLVFTTSFSSRILSSVGITLLGVFSTPFEVGVYSAVNKIPTILMLAWLPIAQILYPISSQKMSASFIDGKKFIFMIKRKIIIFFALGAAVISFFSKEIIEIAFGAEYTIYYCWTIPLLLWLLMSINNNFLGQQILIAGGFDKVYSRCFQFTVCSSVLINLVLTYFFKGNGSAWAPLLSELFLTALELREIKKIENSINSDNY